MKQTLFIGAIASVLTLNNAMATGENTVTSKSYVDAQDATKQNIIPVNSASISTKGGNISVPNALVMSPDTTPGVIGERGIWDDELSENSTFTAVITGSSSISIDESVDFDLLRLGGDLIPTARIISQAGVNSLASKQDKMTCAGWPDSVAVADRTDDNCWLWYKN